MIPPDKLDHEALEIDDRDKLREGRTCIVNATVTAVTFCENTVDLILEDDTELNGVPVFYHCQGVKTAKGGIMAFEENDEVLLYRVYDGDGDLEDQYVIGFQDKPHYCNKYLLVILVGSASYGYSNVKVIVWDVLAADFGAIEVNDKLINQWPIPYDDEDFQDWLDLPTVTYLGTGLTRGGTSPKSEDATGQFAIHRTRAVLGGIGTITPGIYFTYCPEPAPWREEEEPVISDESDCPDPLPYWCSDVNCNHTVEQEVITDSIILRYWIDSWTLEKFYEWVYFEGCGGNITVSRNAWFHYECADDYGEPENTRMFHCNIDINNQFSFENCYAPYLHFAPSTTWGAPSEQPYYHYSGINYYTRGGGDMVCTIGYVNTGGMTETYMGEYDEEPVYKRSPNEDIEFTHTSEFIAQSEHVDLLENDNLTWYIVHIVEGESLDRRATIIKNELHTTITHSRWGTIYDYTSAATGQVQFADTPYDHRTYSFSSHAQTGSYYSAKLTFNQIGCDISFWVVGLGYNKLQLNNSSYYDSGGMHYNQVINRTSRVVNAWCAIEDTRGGGEGYADNGVLANMIATVGKEVWDATIPLQADFVAYGQDKDETHDDVNFAVALRLYKEFSH